MFNISLTVYQTYKNIWFGGIKADIFFWKWNYSHQKWNELIPEKYTFDIKLLHSLRLFCSLKDFWWSTSNIELTVNWMIWWFVLTESCLLYFSYYSNKFIIFFVIRTSNTTLFVTRNNHSQWMVHHYLCFTSKELL